MYVIRILKSVFYNTYSKRRIKKSQLSYNLTVEIYVIVIMYPELDSNQHAVKHKPLKPACLPISPPGHIKQM